MALRDIRLDPDPVLRVVCDPVLAFDSDLAALADDMLDTMYAAPGRGLAAPQVGVTRRIFVMDATWKSGEPTPMVFVNPRVQAVAGAVVTQAEGCLSIPGRTYDVTRPAIIDVVWQDVAGGEHHQRFDGFAAACIQHENDHLNGILIIDPQRGAI